MGDEKPYLELDPERVRTIRNQLLRIYKLDPERFKLIAKENKFENDKPSEEFASRTINIETTDFLGGRMSFEYEFWPLLEWMETYTLKPYLRIRTEHVEAAVQSPGRSLKRVQRAFEAGAGINAAVAWIEVEELIRNQFRSVVEAATQDLIFEGFLLAATRNSKKVDRKALQKMLALSGMPDYVTRRTTHPRIFRGKGRESANHSVGDVETIFSAIQHEASNGKSKIMLERIARVAYPRDSDPGKKVRRLLKAANLTWQTVVEAALKKSE
jgi:hypothetical protein